MPYISRTITSGDLLEKEIYFATRDGKKLARAGNSDPTPEQMAKVNEKNAQRKLQRQMCANFSREAGDVFVTFTHADEIDEARAVKEARNLMDRIKRLRKRLGMEELKYIIVTEKQSHWHHHVIMNGGLTYEQLQQLWGERGRKMAMSTLDDSDGFRGLARYLCEDHKPKRGGIDAGEVNAKEPRRKYQRRWKASRNLKKPVVEKRQLKRLPSRGEPKAPKGYMLIPDSWQYTESRFGIYTYAAFVRIEKGGGKRVRKIQKRDRGTKGKAKAQRAVLECGGAEGQR